jgi:predicted small lipoprotein YifL
MKNKIASLTVIALAAMALAGCGRQPANQSPAPANPPAGQQTPNATNSINTNAPAANDSSNTNNPASTRQ